MFNRKIIGELRNWASRADRKPLILRGARQVGKTVAVNMFAADFDNYVYLDLQKSENQALFRRNLPIKKILQVIALQQNTDLSIGKCLLFLDEIQDSPEGTAALRYFFEEVPELFVIAAGSLLEIMMEYRRISFPVGRVEYRYLYPIDFTEYLQATGESVTLQYFNEIPLQSLAHNKILELFHQYTMIGGMPEIVGQFAESHDVMKLRNLYEGLFTTYMNDVSKYALSAA
ncbi:MAG: AAA family ATPase, partial [Candidatus Marinimicrobia bacterium]|nr:AAA family ATPase [Candidatus Neomarinimicrobiota bacterium]